MSRTIRIHYHRPPDRMQLFEQRLLHEGADVLVTYLEATPITQPIFIGEHIALEPAAPAIWFTFPGRAHDIGRFHTADGVFTGIYANVITPVEIRAGDEWHTTDLFLDVWLSRENDLRVLDEDELRAAQVRGWISAETAAGARAEAARIVTDWRAGSWPPAVVNEWTLERVSSAGFREG